MSSTLSLNAPFFFFEDSSSLGIEELLDNDTVQMIVTLAATELEIERKKKRRGPTA
jgi:hypothetical protein